MNQINNIYINTPDTAAINLQYLNIRDLTPLIPKLHQFYKLNSLCLHGNKINNLPSLEGLKNLQQLDITNNPIKIDNKLLDSLFLIPSLESLVIDIKSEDGRISIIQSLPKLKYLNGKEIQRKKITGKNPNQEIESMKKKLQSQQQVAKKLLNKIYKILDQKFAAPDSSEEFHYNLKCIMQEFEYFYANINNDLAKQCVYLYYKSKLYQVVDANLMNFLEDSGYQNFAKAIDQVNKYKKDNFQDILRVCLSYAYEQDYQKKTLAQGNKLRKQVLYQNQITRLKKKVADLSKENQDLQQTNQKYLQKIYQGGKKQGRNKLTTNMNSANRTLSSSKVVIDNSQNRVKSPLKNISLTRTPSKSNVIQQQQSVTPPIKNQGRLTLMSNSKPQVYRQIQKSPSYRVLPKNKQNQFMNFKKTNSLGQLSVNKLKNQKSMKSIPKISPQNQQLGKINNNKVNQNHQKKITLDQMIQLIDDFLYEKGKFNVQCYSKGQLFQTPQQFLYTYFLRKYGLKDMALDWSLLIIKTIQKYSKENFLIQVFGKILKNNIEEEFYLRSKQFQQYVNSNVPYQQVFEQSDIQRIFYSVFSDQDSETFQKFLPKIPFQLLKGQKRYRRRPLIYRLQSFCVQLHQKQIAIFLNHFKSCDQDDDGVLEQKQIQKCIFNFLKKYDQSCAYSQDYLEQKYEKILSKRRKKGNIASMTFSQFILIMRENL